MRRAEGRVGEGLRVKSGGGRLGGRGARRGNWGRRGGGRREERVQMGCLMVGWLMSEEEVKEVKEAREAREGDGGDGGGGEDREDREIGSKRSKPALFW